MSCIVCKKETSTKCSVCLSIFYCSSEHQRENWKVHKKNCCQMMRIEDDPVFGEQWVATKHLEPGTLLLQELPVFKSIFWPTDSQKNSYRSKALCLTCGQIISLKSKCGGYSWSCWCEGCSWPMCSEKCAKNPIHVQNECKLFKESEFKFPPQKKEITPRRINLAVDIARAITLKRENEKNFEKLINLQHRPSMDLTPEQERLGKEDGEVLKKHLDYSSRGITDDEVVALPWIRKLNAFRFDKITNRLGIHCTYLKASKFSNSCAPNCYMSIQPQGPDFKIQIQTAADVKNGEPLTIAYLAEKPFEGTLERQRKLLKLFFVCKCKRCLDPSELDSHLQAVTCPICYEELKNEEWLLEKNEGFMLPKDPLSLEKDAVWICNRCPNTEIASSFLPKVKALEKSVLEAKSDDVMFYNELLEDNIGELLHQSHYVILMMIQQMLRCFNKKSRDLDFNTHKTHLMHLLSVNEKLFPGLSYWRSVSQLELAMFLKTAAMKSMNEELSEDIRVSKSLIEEALNFFEKFRNEVPDGVARSKAMAEIQEYFQDMELI